MLSTVLNIKFTNHLDREVSLEELRKQLATAHESFYIDPWLQSNFGANVKLPRINETVRDYLQSLHSQSKGEIKKGVLKIQQQFSRTPNDQIPFINLLVPKILEKARTLVGRITPKSHIPLLPKTLELFDKLIEAISNTLNQTNLRNAA